MNIAESTMYGYRTRRDLSVRRERCFVVSGLTALGAALGAGASTALATGAIAATAAAAAAGTGYSIAAGESARKAQKQALSEQKMAQAQQADARDGESAYELGPKWRRQQGDDCLGIDAEIDQHPPVDHGADRGHQCGCGWADVFAVANETDFAWRCW